MWLGLEIKQRKLFTLNAMATQIFKLQQMFLGLKKKKPAPPSHGSLRTLHDLALAWLQSLASSAKVFTRHVPSNPDP